MLEELLQRIKLADRGALCRAAVVQLRAIKEDLTVHQVDEHLDVLLADPGRPGYFASAKGRQAALRKALDEVEAGGRGRERDDLPPLDPAALKTRLRHLGRVVVGLPAIDRALLDDRGDKSYAWIQDGAITALGPERTAIEEACQPYRVHRPSWQAIWVEVTGGDANPWRPPGEAELATLFHAALDKTFGHRPPDGYGARHPLAAMRHAVDDWARADARELIGRLTATATGEARPVDAHQSANLLGELARRHGALPGAALVPLLLGELAASAAVEMWPTPPGLRFDLIGRTAAGHARVRAIALRGTAAAWHAIAADDLPRATHLFEGGNLVLALGEP
jgi:hypothetical protein